MADTDEAMFPRRRRLLLEWLEDRAAPARVAPERELDMIPIAPRDFDRAINFTCSFLDALTPLSRTPETAPRPFFINDFLIDLMPDRGTETISLRSPVGSVYRRLMAA